jgi:hypothetical protein
MNLKDKDSLDMAWDVHAERLVSCGDCHYSTDRPTRLAGEATPANVEPASGTRRRCESCHSIEGVHDWLPERARHMRAVACESCHVPELEMAARQQVDYTVMRADGSPVIDYRGLVHGSVDEPTQVMIDGYEPLLRVGTSVDGEHKVLPYNLISSWRWIDAASGEAISPTRLRQAWLEDDAHAAEVIRVFDADGDGELDGRELRLDSSVKEQLIRTRLIEAGATEPVIRAEVRAYHIHHNIRHGEEINRDCAACHPKGQGPAARLSLGQYVPGGVLPSLAEDSMEIVLDGEFVVDEKGGLVFESGRGAAKSYQSLQKVER